MQALGSVMTNKYSEVRCFPRVACSKRPPARCRAVALELRPTARSSWQRPRAMWGWHLEKVCALTFFLCLRSLPPGLPGPAVLWWQRVHRHVRLCLNLRVYFCMYCVCVYYGATRSSTCQVVFSLEDVYWVTIGLFSMCLLWCQRLHRTDAYRTRTYTL
jgi:hypothetical protein